MIYIVSKGDTVYSIASRYGISPERIIIDNGIFPPYKLSVGQALLILIPYITHTVQEGETLLKIGEKYSVSQNELYQKNYSLKGISNIYPGQTIIISYTNESRDRNLLTSSYAYPFITQGALREVMPYLSGMVPFTYGFTENGELVSLDDSKIISASKEYGTSPFLHLSTLTSDGKFDNSLSGRLFSNNQAKTNLINQILNTLASKGYYGVDLDFEFVPKSDAEGYIEFARQLKNALSEKGYILIIALAPKISDTQTGLLYEGHNYAELGKIADYVLLMTYEWGYEYSRPMAVAPINNVKQVISYALEKISSNKILLGIPNYGYNWPLPYIEGTTRAVSLGNTAAPRIAAEFNAEIKYDAESKTPYFNYTDNSGIAHEVWFEDPRSISQKLMLVRNYDLAGIGIWNAMREFPSMWLQIATSFNIIDF